MGNPGLRVFCELCYKVGIVALFYHISFVCLPDMSSFFVNGKVEYIRHSAQIFIPIMWDPLPTIQYLPSL